MEFLLVTAPPVSPWLGASVSATCFSHMDDDDDGDGESSSLAWKEVSLQHETSTFTLWQLFPAACKAKGQGLALTPIGQTLLSLGLGNPHGDD